MNTTQHEMASPAFLPEHKAMHLPEADRVKHAQRFARNDTERRRLLLQPLRAGLAALKDADTPTPDSLESKQDDLNLDVPSC